MVPQPWEQDPLLPSTDNAVAQSTFGADLFRTFCRGPPVFQPSLSSVAGVPWRPEFEELLRNNRVYPTEIQCAGERDATSY